LSSSHRLLPAHFSRGVPREAHVAAGQVRLGEAGAVGVCRKAHLPHQARHYVDDEHRARREGQAASFAMGTRATDRLGDLRAARRRARVPRGGNRGWIFVPKTTLPELGRNLRRVRTAAGLTQTALAKRSGIDRSYVSGLEAGQRNPTALTLKRLAEVLGVTPTVFFL
jgi:DNA-binding XRE family transcriptional regulator